MRGAGRILFVCLSMALWVAATVGCGGEGTKAEGTEGGPCYANNTCNEGLVCASNICVRLHDVGEDAADAALDTGAPDTPEDTAVADTPQDTAVADTPQDTAVADTPQDTAVPDTGPTDTGTADTKVDTAEEVCTPHPCTDYATCSQYEACEPCPEEPAEKCNGKDDDCDDLTDEDTGLCPPGQQCRGGVCCTDECPTQGEQECVGSDKFRTCGNYDDDGCLEWTESDCEPGEACTGGSCGCVPETCTSLGKECGTWSDGCGTSLDCGSCADNESCNDGTCECAEPLCGGVCCEVGDVCRSAKCCTPHDHMGCYDDDVYWYDSCDNREERKENCGSGEVCYNNDCCTLDTCGPSDCGTLDDGCGGEIQCGDLDNDEDNCGECGKQCGDLEECDSGQCCCGFDCGGVGVGPACTGTEACCSAAGPCTDLAFEEAHCGACGVACGDKEECKDATCCCGSECETVAHGPACTGTKACCDSSGPCTVILGSDHANCGACGFDCTDQDNVNSTGTTCDGGQCDFNCDSGYEDCDDIDSTGCEAELATDFDNCGECGNSCGPEGDACISGRCDCDGITSDACPSGFWCSEDTDDHTCECRNDDACFQKHGSTYPKCCPIVWGPTYYECCNSYCNVCVDLQPEE